MLAVAAFNIAVCRLLFSTFDSGLDSQALQAFNSRKSRMTILGCMVATVAV